MSLFISPEVKDQLPPVVKNALSKLSEDKQTMFEHEYKSKRRSYALHQTLSIIFPIQHFIRGEVLLGLIYWLTAGGLWVWWFIEVVTQKKKVRTFNEGIATDIVRDIKSLT